MIDVRLRHQIRTGVTGTVLLLLALTASPAQANVLETLNKARSQGCGVHAPLLASARLDQVARLLSDGAGLQAAQRRAGYHSTKVLSLALQGVSDERSLERMLRRQLCAEVGTPDLSELGAYRRGTYVWIVLGQPFVAPDPRQREAISERVLQLTNQARSHARRCGGRWFPAAAPLAPDALLEQAARGHSQDMAAHGYLAHAALDGSTPAERVSHTGYAWRVVGENLASGISTADEAVAGWLSSPEHCANLMGGQYRQMGSAFGVNLATDDRVYWTQVLGTPR